MFENKVLRGIFKDFCLRDVTLCSLVDRYLWGGDYCLHHEGRTAIFEPKPEEVGGGLKEMNNEELHDSHFSPNVRAMKSWRMRRA